MKETAIIASVIILVFLITIVIMPLVLGAIPKGNKMPLPKYIGAYHDIAEVLDRAVSMGGASLEFDARNARTRWRQRAYMFRTLYRATLKAGTASRYDRLTIVVPEPDDEKTLIIKEMNNCFGLVSVTPLDHKPEKDMTPEERMAQEFLDELGGKR